MPDTGPKPSIAPTRPARVPHLGLIWLALVLVISSALRAWLTATGLGASTECGYCLAGPVLGHDAWLLALGWGLLAIAASVQRPWLRTLLVLPVLALMLLMAADVAVLTTLDVRLYLLDVFKFGMEGAAVAGFMAALLRSSGAPWLVLAVLGLLLSFTALRPQPASRRLGRALGGCALGAVLAALLTRALDPAYIYAEAYLNLFELHFAQSVNAPYSPGFVRELAARKSELPLTCAAAQQRHPDVIVLAVESLSNYQSALHGGPLALTPELDAIARSNTWFSRFHANGFTTDEGLIALLTGRAPIPAIGRYRSLDAFAGFDDPRHSIAATLHSAGYSVNFFTTGDLGFLDKGPWLKALGFDHWEGAEQPFYEGWPRGGFNAAEDRALYLRLLDWIGNRDDSKPFLAFALTVQSHPPFINPETRRFDEPAVIQSIDREVGRFERELRARGFFEHGLLLITGDHRSMTPLHPEERAAHGDVAFALVPMVVVGKSGLPPGRVDLPFQQTDLLPSLADLVDDKVCTRADQGRFLRADPKPPEWILHARGDARSRVDVYFGDQRGALVLAGDDSHWVGTQPPQWRAIADEVHRDRIRRGALESDIEGLIEILGR